MSIWPNVITGVCTLLAGLGGVWITQRGTASRTVEEWRDKHRIDQRQAVVEVLHLGRHWTYSLSWERTALAMSENGEHYKLLKDNFNTSYADDLTAFQRALTTARIVVDIEDVTVHIRALTALGNPVIDEASKLVAASEPDRVKRMEAAGAPSSTAEEILRRLEHAATQHLGAPQVPRRSRLRQSLSRRRRSTSS